MGWFLFSSKGKSDLQLVYFPTEVQFVRHSDLWESKQDYYNLGINKKFEKVGVDQIKCIASNSKKNSSAPLEMQLINGERIPLNLLANSSQRKNIIESFLQTYDKEA